MFDLIKQIEKNRQLAVDKIQGLPPKPKSKNPPVQHISEYTDFDSDAAQEGNAIAKRPKYRNRDFGIRLRKSSGEKHRPRGHYQCSNRGI